jgi:hypothetical protein
LFPLGSLIRAIRVILASLVAALAGDGRQTRTLPASSASQAQSHRCITVASADAGISRTADDEGGQSIAACKQERTMSKITEVARQFVVSYAWIDSQAALKMPLSRTDENYKTPAFAYPSTMWS